MCIKIFLNKQFAHKIAEHTVPKKELSIVLQYLGMHSLCLRTCLQKSVNNNISFCKIKIIFKSSTGLAHFFRFKDQITLCLWSNIVYIFTCGRCNAAYYGKTCHQLVNTQVSLAFNEQAVQIKKSTAVKDHMLMGNQLVFLTILKCLLLVTLSLILKSNKIF